MRMFVCFALLTGLASACRQSVPDDDKDGIVNPVETDTDVDDTEPVDPDHVPVPVVGQVVGLVSGTGSGSSPGYQATIVIGGPAVTTPTNTSPQYTTHVGIGAVQAVEAP